MDWERTREREEKPKRSFLGLFRRQKAKPIEEVEDVDAAHAEKRRITLSQPNSYVTEQFRTLRGRIDAFAVERPIRTVAVTSANPGEGKSTSSISLAVVSAMSVGRRVLLLDCDMRRPAIHTALGLEPKVGIAEVLNGEATLDEALITMQDTGLDVLCVCSQPSNPSELLASEAMRQLVRDVSDRYDRVVLDTPVTLGLPDAKTVGDLCDGIVFVVRAGGTKLPEIESCLDLLDRRRVLGLVLNAAEADEDKYGY